MLGTILGYDESEGTGAISADDGARYRFSRADWKSGAGPAAGAKVDFETADGAAREIYAVGPAPARHSSAPPGTLLPPPPAVAKARALFTSSLATPLGLVVLIACLMPALSSPMMSVSLLGLGDLPMLSGIAVLSDAPSAAGLSSLQSALVLRFAAPLAALWLIWCAWTERPLRLPMIVTGGSAMLAAALVFLFKWAILAAVGGMAADTIGALVRIGLGTWLLLAAGGALVAAGFGRLRNPLAGK
ncbi:hypothetical protein [Sphingosinicella terrae]|uniref:hypothetical protein n=1 Tax=Sphingosinicella terrae TaxID=2172047 RepID=UPI000E0CD59F|nr:hypothetical protein [Sphingosinicella terrae]